MIDTKEILRAIAKGKLKVGMECAKPKRSGRSGAVMPFVELRSPAL